MSRFDLREFNVLSKRHNYFMTNNRINGFPFMNENSILLKKILTNRASNSSDKRLETNQNNSKPKKFVRFAQPENIPYKNIYQSPIILNDEHNNSNEVINNNRYPNILYSNNLKKIKIYSNINNIGHYRKNAKLITDSNLDKQNHYKIAINNSNINQNSPIIYKHCRFNSNSNNNIFDNDNIVLSFKGRKIFSNSFSALNNNSKCNSPIKNEYNNSIKESELFRNSEELKKKKEEIFLRKMNRESSALRREILRKEKDKDIKDQKIDININSLNNSSKKNDNSDTKNRIRIIPLNKEINYNIGRKTNRFISNDNNNNNHLKNSNSFNINIKSRNKILSNNQINNSNIRGIYKVSNDNNNNNKNENNDLNNTIKKDKDIKPLNNNNSLYNNNSFKSNNIFMSKYSERTPPKNKTIRINNKIKENLNFLRKSKNSDINDNINRRKLYENKNNNQKISPDTHNNPYEFMTTKKKFCEDYTQEDPIIYSKDKKVSIKVHNLANINEIFLGKRQTKEKLKMQRVISIIFNNKDNIKNRVNNPRSYRFYRKMKDFNSIKSIKEEEKSKEDSKINKTERDVEIQQKPVLEKNVRRKYIRRFGNNK